MNEEFMVGETSVMFIFTSIGDGGEIQAIAMSRELHTEGIINTKICLVFRVFFIVMVDFPYPLTYIHQIYLIGFHIIGE